MSEDQGRHINPFKFVTAFTKTHTDNSIFYEFKVGKHWGSLELSSVTGNTTSKAFKDMAWREVIELLMNLVQFERVNEYTPITIDAETMKASRK